MPAPVLNLKRALRDAIIGNAAIVALLGKQASKPSVFTRKPVPANALEPMITIEQATRGDEDGINDFRPVVSIDLIVYGQQPVMYRKVEEIAEMLYVFFHGCPRGTLDVTGYSVTRITCIGPSPAPTDDETEVARAVTLTARLASTA